MRLLSDQITEGQLQWVPLDKQYDTVIIGDAENAKRYPVCGGWQDDYKKALYKSFPKEKEAIDRYMDMLKVSLTYVYVVWNVHWSFCNTTGISSYSEYFMTQSVYMLKA